MQAKDRIIFPLDGMDRSGAIGWMQRLYGNVGYVKIGLELFTRYGPEIVQVARREFIPVMLDLKLHDIPATMEAATKLAVEEKVALLTVHASAGREAMERCVKATHGSTTSIVAVTVLTSLDEEFIQRVFQPMRHKAGCIPNVVESLAREAIDAGVAHFVCSPHEASLLRSMQQVEHAKRGPTRGVPMAIITPGIRLAGGDVHDQKRVNTPGAAVEAGADYLVIGRAIRGADDPDVVIKAICKDIDGVI